jgi:uncharacterized membrane protein YqjE
VGSKPKAIFNTYEKWAWLAVMLTWGLALLFAAALVLIDLKTIIIYLFPGTEENPLLAVVFGVVVLVVTVALSFEIRNRMARPNRQSRP